ncbi:ComEA family DNA-binding protein [Legionella micdadei]|uniref:Competence protein ComEA n=1 Tax=Legionella micdadei TaxID=451 RepID=A0A098GH96_LEGMI|nr:helix-hairpin-helix domain-containing protein [Legionella micdadei]ARG97191.1 competence protein ComEA [Legionella micdadei]ARH00550.1 competence protein ComEA [Legionella micdadei]KTD29205.1 competence protein ComEA [Legionella micdadei]NSL17422.1 helix-hairpin-helix domain-containing protein [Legionella micdadei]CEG61357.1 conserved exported protein of unknown function [Legionella micdadei]
MKANLFAAVLLLSIAYLPAHAASEQLNKSPALSMQKSTAKIDLNKADLNTLVGAAKGIGQKRAEAIVKYRTEHGNFNSIEGLSKVPGLGNRFVKNHLKELEKVFMVN